MTLLAELIKNEEYRIDKNLSKILDHNERHEAIAEWVYAKTENFINSSPTHNEPTNKEHHNLMQYVATELNIHFDEVAVSCAKWAHKYDYTPPK